MSLMSISHRFFTIGMVLVMLLFAQACSPIDVPAQSATEQKPPPTTDPNTGYPPPDDSAIVPTPQPTQPPMPTETPYPTRVIESGGQDVVIPGGNLVVSLPEGWFASSESTRMSITNYLMNDDTDRPAAGEERIVVQLTIPTGVEDRDANSLIQEVYNRQVASATDIGVDAADIQAPEECVYGGLSGYCIRDNSRQGFLTAFLTDSNGNSVWVLVTPTTSPFFEDAIKILAAIRFK